MDNLFRLAGRFVGGRLLLKRAYPILRGPLRGARFVLGALSGEGGGSSVYFGMVEPEQTAVFTVVLSEGQALFDIGANVGYYTILGSRLVGAKGRVFAFEPVMRNLFYLQRHIIINKADNVTILPVACSDRVGLAFFRLGKDFATGRLEEKLDSKNRDRDGDGFPVPVVTVDEVVRQSGVLPAVLKIDVEGGELAALKGAQDLLNRKPKILLSTHSDLLREACLKFLREYGYEFEPLSKDRTNPMEFLAY